MSNAVLPPRDFLLIAAGFALCRFTALSLEVLAALTNIS